MALPPHCANTHICTHIDGESEPHPQWVSILSQAIRGCSQRTWNTTAQDSIILFASLLLGSVYLPMFTRTNPCMSSTLKQLYFIAKHMEKEMSSLVSEQLVLLAMAL